MISGNGADNDDVMHITFVGMLKNRRQNRAQKNYNSRTIFLKIFFPFFPLVVTEIESYSSLAMMSRSSSFQLDG